MFKIGLKVLLNYILKRVFYFITPSATAEVVVGDAAVLLELAV